jgi:GDP-L-fucose synthase
VNLVFGSDSFIAKNISADIKISKAECDLLDFTQVTTILEKYKPISVINCGAAHGSAKAMSKNHSYYLEHNISMDLNVVRASNALGIENVVLMSSVSAFPNIQDRDLVEIDLHKGEVNKYNYGYNTSKRMAYDLCKTYELDLSRNYKVLFLGNLYGKFGKFAKDANVLNSIIYQMHLSKLKNSDLTLYGDGLDSRAFTFVEDLNQILPKFISDKSICSAIFSSNEVVTIKQLTSLIADLMGFGNKIIFTGEATAGQKRKVASSSYLQNKLPELTYTDLKSGLNLSIEWYLKSVVNLT